MFSLKLLLITATVMMSVISNDTIPTTSNLGNSTATAISDTTVNQCYSTALGATNQPKSSSDCVGAPNTPVGNNCCYVSMKIPVTDVTPLSVNFCYAVPTIVDSNAVSSILSSAFSSSNLTLNSFSCASSFVQVSVLLIAILGLLF